MLTGLLRADTAYFWVRGGVFVPRAGGENFVLGGRVRVRHGGHRHHAVSDAALVRGERNSRAGKRGAAAVYRTDTAGVLKG